MIIETITTESGITYTEIKAENGLRLTNGEIWTEPDGGICLGIYDKPENYRETNDEPPVLDELEPPEN